MKLNYTKCDNAKPAEKTYKMADGHGMFMEVRPNGAKYWRMRYRYNGKQKLLALGVYPEVTLKEAREKRDEARKMLENGVDPSQQKQESKHQAYLNAENTFEAIAREWHDNQRERWSESHANRIIHRLEIDVFPEIGHRPVSEINPPELLRMIRKTEHRGANQMARRALQMCGQIFRYAIVTGRAERDPSGDLKGALKPYKKGHFAALDIKQLPDFIKTLQRNDARLYGQTRNALELLLYTFVRTGELINARWDEIDFDNAQWIIPAERMKMRKSHIVPLSKQALDILHDEYQITGGREYVFASHIHPRQPISNNTILKAIERMGYKGYTTGHGFRSLAMSTIKEKLNYRHEVIDRQLAHAHKSEVTAAYDRAEFLDERKQMMQDWADYLESLESS